MVGRWVAIVVLSKRMIRYTVILSYINFIRRVKMRIGMPLFLSRVLVVWYSSVACSLVWCIILSLTWFQTQKLISNF